MTAIAARDGHALVPPEHPVTAAQFGELVRHYDAQVAAQTGQHLKAVHGMELVIQLHQEQHLRSKDAMDFLSILDQTVRYEEPYGEMFREFHLDQCLELLKTLDLMARTGGINIGAITAMDLPTAPIRRPGRMARWLQEMFTGTDDWSGA